MDTTARHDDSPGATAREPAIRTESTHDIRAAAVVAVGLALLGLGLGPLWSAISPRVHLVITAAGPDLAGGSGGFFAGDASFALLGAGVGLLTGVAAWYAGRRWRGPALMTGLLLGSVAGGLVAWQVGRWIGLSSYHSLLHSTDVGRRFVKPVDLRSKAALLPQPFFALAGYLLLAAWVARPDLGRGHHLS